MTTRRFLLVLLTAILTFGLTALAATPVRLESFSPQGLVKEPRQVVARFSAPMVRFGDPRRAPEPLVRECSGDGVVAAGQTPSVVDGDGRWLDSRTWAFDFRQNLPPGVSCRYRTAPGLTSAAGAAVSPAEFELHTGGPQVSRTEPFESSEEIDEEQAFVVFVDALPDPASVERGAWFTVAGLHDRVGVRILTGADREAILNTLYPDYRKEPSIVLQARQRFPNEADVTLHWSKAITTAGGIATALEQKLSYKTRPQFRARLSCDRMKPNADCIPLLPLTLRFEVPVRWELAKQIELTAPDGRKWLPESRSESEDTVDAVLFEGPFPESTTFKLTVPADFKDDSGRPLANAAEFPLTLRTDAFPPLAKFAGRFGIIEAKSEPALPVTVRNIEAELKLAETRVTAERDAGVGARISELLGGITGKVQALPLDRLDLIQPWLRRVGWARYASSIFAGAGDLPPGGLQSISLPKPNGEKAFEVIGIPLSSPGLYVVELESPRLGQALLEKGTPFYVATAALVSNMSVHFKWGAENALAWVTTLEDSTPVAGAEITVQDCKGLTLWTGTSDANGIARIQGLPPRAEIARCDMSDADWPDESSPLTGLSQGVMVIARTPGDISFVHSSWDDGIDLWRFGIWPSSGGSGHGLEAHTILDRSLLRAGETVHMKHLVRAQKMLGFDFPAADRLPSRVAITHLGSGQRYDLAVSFDAAGIAVSDWKIPEDARLGRYQVELSLGEGMTRESASFRVEQFRVPLMKAGVRFPEAVAVAPQKITVDLSAEFLAGGGAANLPVTLRTQVRPLSVDPPHAFERFLFANGPVETGTRRHGTWDEESSEQAAQPPVDKQTVTLDAVGAARAEVAAPAPIVQPSELLAEMEFRDPSGEIQTVASTLPLWPAQWIVGMQSGDWGETTEQLSGRLVVLDRQRKAVPGAAVRVDVFERKVFSSRKRLVGGFYGYEHSSEVVGPIARLCEGRTEANGIFTCEGKPPHAGSLLLQATVTDPDGHTSVANVFAWVYDEKPTWFEVSPGDRMDVLADRPRYEPGETAHLQVRMPFRRARALVTVEREGVLDAWPVELSGERPVVDVPIKPEYAPNAFLSVMAVRGRIGDVQPTALLDLGKPAFKLGMTEVDVGWKRHQLQVTVSPEREVYRTRERAAVKVAVRTADGAPLPAGAEVAIAAVDAGLLELAPNTSWDLLESMMDRRDLMVATSTSQLQVVGKRHFGLKAVPIGGGGGRQTTRELFDTLLYWSARVALDASGTATVEIPLNDSLTSFEIVAVATAAADRFGTGRARIRATKDLMLMPGLAPLAREGDLIRAELTVRNASDRELQVEVSAAARRDGGSAVANLPAQTTTLAAGASSILIWPIEVPIGATALDYQFDAKVVGQPSTDSVRFHQTVQPAVPVRTFQATLTQLKGRASEPVEIPSDAIPGRGGVKIGLAPSLAGSLEGVRDWMESYPYICLEQRLSVAVALHDGKRWSTLLGEMPTYIDENGLLKYFPGQEEGSPILSAYVLAITQAAGLELPETIRDRIVGGLKGFVDGSLRPRDRLAFADLPLRKLAAIAALARVGAAEPTMLDSIALEPQLWPNNTLVDWLTILERVPGVKQGKAHRADAERVLRARLTQQGTTMAFSSEGEDRLWWLMVTPELAQLRLLQLMAESGKWQAELPRLLRGALQLQRRGAWSTTVANAWGTVAIDAFSKRFEKQPVDGVTTAKLGPAERSYDWKKAGKETAGESFRSVDSNQGSGPRAETLLPWPVGPTSLDLSHAGTGAPWVTVQSLAAIPLTRELNAGYRIERTATASEQKQPGKLSRGDIVQVHLSIEASADMTWVVVNDPIPAGATVLGSGLGRDAQLAGSATTSNAADDWESWWRRPAYVERRFDSYRAYYQYLPKGKLELDYRIRLNQAGRFELPPTRVEALYAPEMFAERPNEDVTIEE